VDGPAGIRGPVHPEDRARLVIVEQMFCRPGPYQARCGARNENPGHAQEPQRASRGRPASGVERVVGNCADILGIGHASTRQRCGASETTRAAQKHNKPARVEGVLAHHQGVSRLATSSARSPAVRSRWYSRTWTPARQRGNYFNASPPGRPRAAGFVDGGSASRRSSRRPG
jgi:hypothetical protein